MDMTESEWFQETLRIRCPDGKVPAKLFKFLSSDSKYFALAMHELMLHNRIRLSSRTEFNDPFDTRFGLDIPDSPEVVASFIEGIATRRGATEAADDYRLVKELVDGGMDCARINCAHDTPDVWERMVRNVHRARKANNDRECLISFDLPGPKLRTGALEPGPQGGLRDELEV